MTAYLWIILCSFLFNATVAYVLWCVIRPSRLRANLLEIEADLVDAAEQAGLMGDSTEIDRLSHLLSLYDLCECGWERHHHAGCDTQGRAPGATAGCPDFRLHRPADPLETIVEVSK